MPEIVADSPDPSCYHLHSESKIRVSQGLDPDLFSSRAREVRGLLLGALCSPASGVL